MRNLIGPFADSLGEFIEQEVRALGGHCGVAQMFDARIRDDSIASVAALTIFVREAHRGNTEIRLSAKARRSGFRRLYESERLGMAAEECLQRRSGELSAISRSHCAQELQEFLAVPDRECVDGMTDDIGVNAIGQMKPNRAPVRVGIGVGVGNHGNAGRVGKTN